MPCPSLCCVHQRTGPHACKIERDLHSCLTWRCSRGVEVAPPARFARALSSSVRRRRTGGHDGSLRPRDLHLDRRIGVADLVEERLGAEQFHRRSPHAQDRVAKVSDRRERIAGHLESRVLRPRLPHAAPAAIEDGARRDDSCTRELPTASPLRSLRRAPSSRGRCRSPGHRPLVRVRCVGAA